ncbi:hypothetical protein [Nocardia alba]|uniref:hypothetical protein n=1 Tax=Nocardia alba TaxID=225051 RepID=UPI00140469A9|nr:hypothetical protein [Nocardia alba]
MAAIADIIVVAVRVFLKFVPLESFLPELRGCCDSDPLSPTPRCEPNDAPFSPLDRNRTVLSCYWVVV